MPEHEYSVDIDDEKCAKAYGKELHISPKDSVEICKEIKGMRLERAKEFLRNVINKKETVEFERHDGKRGHKRGDGKKAGGYPVKSAEKILEVLENAEANAEYEGLIVENLRVIHASAKEGIEFPGIQPRAFGRASPSQTPTTNVEIVVRGD